MPVVALVQVGPAAPTDAYCCRSRSPATASARRRTGAGPLCGDADRVSNRRVQPGVKVRGAEYLRIIYGPDYTEPVNLDRLRERGLGHKRSMALREHALGAEAPSRLGAGEALWRVHEAVFAVLALESEPVDPRL